MIATIEAATAAIGRMATRVADVAMLRAAQAHTFHAAIQIGVNHCWRSKSARRVKFVQMSLKLAEYIFSIVRDISTLAAKLSGTEKAQLHCLLCVS